MSRFKQMLATALAVTFIGANVPHVQAQRQTNRPYRVSDAQVESIIRRLETNTDRYRESLDTALDRSRYNGTQTEDEINRLVRDFEYATDNLRERFNDRQDVAGSVEEVFDRAIDIDDFMRRNQLGARAEQDWRTVRQDLQQLGRNYNLSYRRYGRTQRNDTASNFPTDLQGTSGTDARLTGTYRLDARASDDPRTIADSATRSLSRLDRQRVYDALLPRLTPPSEIALERRSDAVTIASSNAPQVTIQATGREELERYPNNRNSRVRAQLSGDTLTITSTGERDRTTDFTARFESLDDGRQLRVTRTVYADRLSQPVTVRSIYNRTSDYAQFNVYREGNLPRETVSNTGNSTYGTSRNFIIPDGTRLNAVLDTNISTKESREGDRFTMTVRDSGQFDGAVLEGYLSDIERSGRVTGRSELTFNFERIRLRNGRTYNFAGAVEGIRTASGEEVRVGGEGSAQEDNNQTERTVQRAAIGSAVGALIGAIAGGGKGAAIGAAIGAGAGAGSVYVQGRDDLQLMSGTEVTVRASAPR